MTIQLDGKVAVVTGGAAGIGRATALAFAQAGARVVVVDQVSAEGEQSAALAREAGADAIFVQADVTRSRDVSLYVQAAMEAFGAIDCFFNNAGIEGRVTPTAEYDEAVFDAVIAVNLKGVFLGLKHVLPVMVRQGRGAIVNTSSTAGLIGAPGLSAYVASKHAVIGLTRTAASEYGAHGIRVNAICPGPTDTRMVRTLEDPTGSGNGAAARARLEAAIPLGRYCTAEEVANVALFLCSDLASGVSGAAHLVDGGRSASSSARRPGNQ